MRRYAVIGLGAVGGLYGGRLAAAGHEVHFLVRDAARIRGLHVRSIDGDLDLPDVRVVERAEDVPPVDCVIVAIKTTGNGALDTVLPVLAGDGTAIVMLQNGLGVEAVAARAVPSATVLGGLCFVCAHRVGPGRIEHLDYGTVTLAEHRPDGSAAGITPTVRALATDLRDAGVTVVEHDDLVLARWKKLVWNVPYNGLSVVLDAGTAEIMADPDARALVRALMEEVQRGAATQGRSIDDAFIEQMLRDTEAMTPYSTSMKLDADEGRPLELEAIYRAPVEIAHRGGVDLPRTRMLLAQLSFLDQRLRVHPPRSRPASSA